MCASRPGVLAPSRLCGQHKKRTLFISATQNGRKGTASAHYRTFFLILKTGDPLSKMEMSRRNDIGQVM
jgi:hypothetical protein